MNRAAQAGGGAVCMLLHGRFPMEVRVAAEVRAAVEAGFKVDVIALRGAGEARRRSSKGLVCSGCRSCMSMERDRLVRRRSTWASLFLPESRRRPLRASSVRDRPGA